MASLHDHVSAPLDAKPDLTIGSLCTGYGGLDLGVIAALGRGRTVWVADPDPHVSAILAARMPTAPNLGDITTVDWSQIERVDVLTAGFPCQDISTAGRRAGIRKGTRSGIWHQVVAAVRHLQPALLIVENVAALRWRRGGLDVVLGDLAEVGYDAHWTSVRASDIAAPHRRERVFLLAYRAGTIFSAQYGAGNPTIGSGEPQARRSREAAPYTASTRRHPWRVLTGVPQGRGTSGEPHRHGDHVPANTGEQQSQRRGGPRRLAAAAGAPSRTGHQRQWDRHAAVDRSEAVADTAGKRHGDVWQESRHRFPPSVVTGGAATLPNEPRGGVTTQQLESGTGDVDWGTYAPAIRRWELARGVAAPHPTEPGAKGRPRLSPVFVEWLMGLAPGWVTNVEIPRTAQLRALGNGVVPQQATLALELMLADLLSLAIDDEEAQAA